MRAAFLLLFVLDGCNLPAQELFEPDEVFVWVSRSSTDTAGTSLVMNQDDPWGNDLSLDSDTATVGVGLTFHISGPTTYERETMHALRRVAIESRLASDRQTRQFAELLEVMAKNGAPVVVEALAPSLVPYGPDLPSMFFPISVTVQAPIAPLPIAHAAPAPHGLAAHVGPTPTPEQGDLAAIVTALVTSLTLLAGYLNRERIPYVRQWTKAGRDRRGKETDENQEG